MILECSKGLIIWEKTSRPPGTGHLPRSHFRGETLSKSVYDYIRETARRDNFCKRDPGVVQRDPA